METFSSTLQSNKRKEFMVKVVLITATAFTIFTTFGILFSILFEAIEFFKMESFWYFITGTEWSPGVEVLNMVQCLFLQVLL